MSKSGRDKHITLIKRHGVNFFYCDYRIYNYDLVIVLHVVENSWITVSEHDSWILNSVTDALYPWQ